MSMTILGLLKSKVALGVIAGGFTLSGAGLLWSGSDILNNANTTIHNLGDKIVSYENGEHSLLGKVEQANNFIGKANGKISGLKGDVATLKEQKATLEGQVEDLTSQVADLEGQLDAMSTELGDTKTALNSKIAEFNALQTQYNTKVAELQTANQTIVDLNNAINYALGKVKEADTHVAELEAEMNKANTEVQAFGQEVEAVKTQTDGKAPLTQSELDSITIADVQE